MFIKNILTGNISIVETIKLSRFRPLGLKTIMKTIPHDNYIVGVGYSEGDYQICISGRKKVNETLSQTLYREMTEELSIYPIIKPEIFFSSGCNNFYKININNTNFRINNTRNTDLDTKERIIACVYGTELDILEYLEEVKISKDNEDRITHIWAGKVCNLIRYLK